MTASESETKTFLEVRDSVRQQAVVYTTKVLPLTEKLVLHMSEFVDYFIDLKYEMWIGFLDIVMNELDDLLIFCNFVINLHADIIKKLRENEDKANAGANRLFELELSYRDESKKLQDEALQCQRDANGHRNYSTLLAVLTLGLSKLYGLQQAAGCERDAKLKTSKAVAKRENAEIAERAVVLTRGTLIPAIKDFLTSLQICFRYFKIVKTNLEKAKNAGEKGAKQPKEIFFETMKAKASKISSMCEDYIAIIPLATGCLDSIPKNPEDKNYAEKWLEEQISEIEKQYLQETSFKLKILQYLLLSSGGSQKQNSLQL